MLYGRVGQELWGVLQSLPPIKEPYISQEWGCLSSCTNIHWLRTTWETRDLDANREKGFRAQQLGLSVIYASYYP